MRSRAGDVDGDGRRTAHSEYAAASDDAEADREAFALRRSLDEAMMQTDTLLRGMEQHASMRDAVLGRVLLSTASERALGDAMLHGGTRSISHALLGAVNGRAGRSMRDAVSGMRAQSVLVADAEVARTGTLSAVDVDSDGDDDEDDDDELASFTGGTGVFGALLGDVRRARRRVDDVVDRIVSYVHALLARGMLTPAQARSLSALQRETSAMARQLEQLPYDKQLGGAVHAGQHGHARGHAGNAAQGHVDGGGAGAGTPGGTGVVERIVEVTRPDPAQAQRIRDLLDQLEQMRRAHELAQEANARLQRQVDSLLRAQAAPAVAPPASAPQAKGRGAGDDAVVLKITVVAGTGDAAAPGTPGRSPRSTTPTGTDAQRGSPGHGSGPGARARTGSNVSGMAPLPRHVMRSFRERSPVIAPAPPPPPPKPVCIDASSQASFAADDSDTVRELRARIEELDQVVRNLLRSNVTFNAREVVAVPAPMPTVTLGRGGVRIAPGVEPTAFTARGTAVPPAPPPSAMSSAREAQQAMSLSALAAKLQRELASELI